MCQAEAPKHANWIPEMTYVVEKNVEIKSPSVRRRNNNVPSLLLTKGLQHIRKLRTRRKRRNSDNNRDKYDSDKGQRRRLNSGSIPPNTGSERPPDPHQKRLLTQSKILHTLSSRLRIKPCQKPRRSRAQKTRRKNSPQRIPTTFGCLRPKIQRRRRQLKLEALTNTAFFNHHDPKNLHAAFHHNSCSIEGCFQITSTTLRISRRRRKGIASFFF